MNAMDIQHTPIPRNEGQVKVNSGNNIKPIYSWGGANPLPGTWQVITYQSPLILSSVSEYPQNLGSPNAQGNDFFNFVNGKFLENYVNNQTNVWRIILNYSGKAANVAAGIQFRIRNLLSGFTDPNVITLPRTSTSGTVSLLTATIADSASLPPPYGTGEGYEFSLNTTDNITIEVDSITRINHLKHYR